MSIYAKLREQCRANIFDRLKSSTILTNTSPFRIPDRVIELCRTLVDDSGKDPELANEKNPYHFAKKRLNKIWQGRDAYQDFEDNPSPLAKLQTMRGAITAYWTDKKWEAAKPSATIGGLAVLSGVNMMWMAEAFGAFTSSYFNSGLSPEFLMSAGNTALHGALWYWSGTKGFQLANELKENAAEHIRGKFDDAIRNHPEIFSHLTQYNLEKGEKDEKKLPPHMALGNAAEDMVSSTIDIGRSGIETTFAIGALTYGLAQNSVPIEMIEVLNNQLGDWGTFAAAMGTIAAYSGFTMHKGAKLGKELEDVMDEKNRADAEFTKTVVLGFEESKGTDYDHAAYVEQYMEAKSEAERKLRELDKIRLKNSKFHTASAVSNWFISPLPAITGTSILEGGLSALAQKTFLASQVQVQMTLSYVSNISQIISSRGNVTVPAKMISELAQQFEIAMCEEEKNKKHKTDPKPLSSNKDDDPDTPEEQDIDYSLEIEMA